ncbi:MAG TPA: hypothetical protein PLO05_05700 [Bacteroidales bacterium]|nr:hypothetical protein [Bacteroidales bacterium]MDD4235047.1 hypothetical protein [Bacteroidales bacterium]HXK81631.1 hypothetical protein [Bacteroidales bacterium]
MNNLLKYILIFIIISFTLKGYGQLYHSFNGYIQKTIAADINNPENNVTTTLQPFYYSDIANIIDSCETDMPNDWLKYPISAVFDSSFRKLYGLRFDVRPMIMAEAQNLDKYLNYGGGLWIASDYKNKLAIEFSIFYQTLPGEKYASFVQESVIDKSFRVMPYYADSLGLFQDFHITYRPFKYLTAEAGYGRHFVGDGYRSMLLSAETFNYPYFKTELNFWNIKYLFMVSRIKDYSFTPSLFGTGYSWSSTINCNVTHHLQWQVSKNFSIGLFESVITDAMPDIYYFNPAIFLRPVEFSLGSSENVLMGLNTKITIAKNYHFYGQFVLDDINISKFKSDIKHFLNPDEEGLEYGFFGNKIALQAGFKTYNFAGVKNLNWFVEWNYARPYTYSHNTSSRNYASSFRPLAHPAGANFKEWVFGLDYIYKRFECELRFFYLRTGLDTENTHYGQDIYKPTMDADHGHNIPVNTYYNTTLQGELNTITAADLQFYYNINPSRGLKIGLGLSSSTHNVEDTYKQRVFQWRVGISSYMYKNYTGF